jgi:drug/metabolite transporter (DMT)-like permease
MTKRADHPSGRTPALVPIPSKISGRLLVLVAALMWSSCGLFAKSPIFADWGPDVRGPMLAFWRAAFAALVLAPLIRRPRWRPGLVPLTAAFTGMNLTYLTAMTLTTAANAIWLQSTAPLWVFLIGSVFLREPVIGRDLVPLGFGLAGVGIILLFEVQGQARTGVAMGLTAGVCYGGVVICLRRLRDENPAWLIALNHAVAAIVLLPWIVYHGCWTSLVQLAVLAAFGAFQMAIPYILLLRALHTIGSQEAVAIGLVEPVLTPVWVYLAWGERPAWWTLVGASLILAGLALRYTVFDRRRGCLTATPPL